MPISSIVALGVSGDVMVDQLPNLGREKEMLEPWDARNCGFVFDLPKEVVMTKISCTTKRGRNPSCYRRLLGENVPLEQRTSFLGAGLYQNFVPSTVFNSSQGEFLTLHPISTEVSKNAAIHVEFQL